VICEKKKNSEVKRVWTIEGTQRTVDGRKLLKTKVIIPSLGRVWRELRKGRTPQ
jgi:hypothetical protein